MKCIRKFEEFKSESTESKGCKPVKNLNNPMDYSNNQICSSSSSSGSGNSTPGYDGSSGRGNSTPGYDGSSSSVNSTPGYD